jgi:hypothetical protein
MVPRGLSLHLASLIEAGCGIRIGMIMIESSWGSPLIGRRHASSGPFLFMGHAAHG